jgi:hypothetical protein
MQESCLRLMGKKLLVSLAMEGKFSSEGLQAINEEDDILMAMARELVTEKGIGEHADAIWAALQKRQEEVFTSRSSETEVAAPELPQAVELALADSSAAAIPQGASFATAMQPLRRKTLRREGPLEGQLTLF